MKDLQDYINENKDKTATISIKDSELNYLLFALAYVHKWDEEAGQYLREAYAKLYDDLYDSFIKAFGQKEADDWGIEKDIDKVQTRA